MSPYIKSPGTDVWYSHYFLKKLNFRIHINRILQKCLRIACKACEILKKKCFLKQKFESPKFVSYASQWCGIGSEMVLGSHNFNFNRTWHPEAFLKIFSKSRNWPQISFFRASCNFEAVLFLKNHFLSLMLRIL